MEPEKLRYYVVGEYGDDNFRPHYHGIIFGLTPCRNGMTKKMQSVCCEPCEVVKKTWGKGHIMLGSLTSESAQYVAGYIVKKMTKKEDTRLGGRLPEFSRMSLKPSGIGASAMEDLALVQGNLFGQALIDETGDVTTVLQHGKAKWPLGRYLRRKLRESLGFIEVGTPSEAMSKLSAEMWLLRKGLEDDKKRKAKSYAEALVEHYKPKTRHMLVKNQIYSYRRNLNETF